MSAPKQTPNLSTFSPKDAADAPNEQGFLFAQLIREQICNRLPDQSDPQRSWEFVEQEYPVTAVDDSQTRIDLILRHRITSNVYISLECKRPNRKYKTWLFFDRLVNPMFYLETFDQLPRPNMISPMPRQEIRRTAAGAEDCAVFNYYLEAAIKRGSDTASSTEAIEKSFRQLIAGHTGLMKKLKSFEPTPEYCRTIPVLVTTADLFEADFHAKNINLATGTIDSNHVKLNPQEFCAVNYRADDTLSMRSHLVNSNKKDVASDIAEFQTRTVFVVNARAVTNYLNWAGSALTNMA